MAKLTGQQLIQKAGKYHTAGKFGQAEKIYKQLLKANPNDLTLLRMLGMLERDRRNLKGALHWFTLAKQVSGDDPIILAERFSVSTWPVQHVAHTLVIVWVFFGHFQLLLNVFNKLELIRVRFANLISSSDTSTDDAYESTFRLVLAILLLYSCVASSGSCLCACNHSSIKSNFVSSSQ